MVQPSVLMDVMNPTLGVRVCHKSPLLILWPDTVMIDAQVCFDALRCCHGNLLLFTPCNYAD